MGYSSSKYTDYERGFDNLLSKILESATAYIRRKAKYVLSW